MRILPPHSLFHRGRYLALGLFAGVVCAGCAKFPDEDVIGTGKRLIFTVTFDGELVDDRGPSPYFYFVGLRASKVRNPPGFGPLPALARNSSNGFIAGRATHFVQWTQVANLGQQTEYRLYRFLDPVSPDERPDEPDDPVLTSPDYGNSVEPIDRDPVEPGERTIRFEIFLSQLVPESELAEYEDGTLQVNFISLAHIRRDNSGDEGIDPSKVYDALGDPSPTGRSEFLSIPLNINQLYRNDSNAQGILEPVRDTAEPRLDIVDWTVEVRED